MTDQQLQELFQAWWKDSFPFAPANKQAAASHVAFAAYALEAVKTLAEYEG